jgi:hypothetical protein
MRITSRARWGARYANGDGAAPLPATALYLHHSVATGTGPAAVRTVEQIGQDRYRAGISYTFLADQLGDVYEGHGIGRKGTHTRGLNSTARAICAIGNYETTHPSAEMLEAIAQLVAHGHQQGWWPPRLTGGHRDAPGAATACPGRHLHTAIPHINQRVAAILTGDEETTMTPDVRDAFAAIHARLDTIDRQGQDTHSIVHRIFTGRWAEGGNLAWLDSRLKPIRTRLDQLIERG